MTNYNLNFDRAYNLLINHEGGFSKDYFDRGNWTSGIIGIGKLKGTKKGISAMRYPKLDIENLNTQQIKVLYYKDYWKKSGCHLMKFPVAFAVFDFAVNSGVKKASKLVQKSVQVKQDGIIGVVSRDAILEMNSHVFISVFSAYRLLYLTSLKQLFKRYGRGWVIRVAKNLLLIKNIQEF